METAGLRCKKSGTNLVREVYVGEVDQERQHLGADERLSADFVDQGEGLEETNFAWDRLLEGAGEHFLDREVEDVDAGEAGEDEPVQLLQQLRVGTTVEDEAPVGVPDQHHPPDEAEEEGVEVGHNHDVPRERK